MKYTRLAEQYLNVYVSGGDEVYALCPFHQDNKPSFAFNVRSGLFICYACGEKGNAKKLLSRLKLDDVPSPTLGDLMSSIDSLATPRVEPKTYPDTWLDRFKLTPEANKYLRSRGLSKQTIADFRLGWNESKQAITIPLHNRLGECVGVNQRFMFGDVKYRYPLGFRRQENLYSYHRVEVRPHLLAVTEGCFDALAFWNIATPAVAIYGSSMSKDQNRLVRMLLPRLVVIAMDNDDAGRKAAQQVANQLAGLQTVCVSVGDEGSDPSSLTSPELSKALRTALKGSEGL